MSTNSGIEWTDATWNPVAGCTPVSPGCLNCYAAGMAHRLEAMGQEKYRGLTVLRNGVRTFNGKITLDEKALLAPLSWRKPRRVFVNSMSDLFHDGVPFDYVDRVFAVMALTPQHTYQVLTKRPERMAGYLNDVAAPDRGANLLPKRIWRLLPVDSGPRSGVGLWPLPNVWLGTSVEDQARADERIPHLLRCPAAVRFLSCEPLLGSLEFSDVSKRSDAVSQLGKKALSGIDWVIIGGESGAGARPCDVEWIRGIVGQCRAAGVPVFVKQMGAWMRCPCFGESPHGCACESGPRIGWTRWEDSKGGDPSEWAADIRVRQFPEAATVPA